MVELGCAVPRCGRGACVVVNYNTGLCRRHARAHEHGPGNRREWNRTQIIARLVECDVKKFEKKTKNDIVNEPAHS